MRFLSIGGIFLVFRETLLEILRWKAAENRGLLHGGLKSSPGMVFITKTTGD
jgi:hypothetical protein